MLHKPRMFVSSCLLWCGYLVAPKLMRPVIHNVIGSFAGIPQQMHQGRTGGVIISGWSVDASGKELARKQVEGCHSRALAIRYEHTGGY